MAEAILFGRSGTSKKIDLKLFNFTTYSQRVMELTATEDCKLALFMHNQYNNATYTYDYSNFGDFKGKYEVSAGNNYLFDTIPTHILVFENIKAGQSITVNTSIACNNGRGLLKIY